MILMQVITLITFILLIGFYNGNKDSIMEKFIEVSDKVKLGFVSLTVLAGLTDKDLKRHIKSIAKWLKK